MESFATIELIACTLTLILGVVAGYMLGARKSKRAKRDIQYEMNAQSVELLEARSETRQLSQYLAAAKRKDRLLHLALTKLKSGTANENAMRLKLEEIERKIQQ